MQWEINQEIDIKHGPQIMQLLQNALMVSGDNEAHIWKVSLLDNGAAVSVSGTITGYFARPDKQTVMVEGVLEGNIASVVLPQAVYAKEGNVQAIMRLSDAEGQVVTLSALILPVRAVLTDAIIDPGELIPSIDNLIAQIAAMEEATARANAAGFNLRGNYNPDADPLYAKHDMVYFNGGSYAYTNDTPSNELPTSTTHWQQIAAHGATGPSAYEAAVAGGYTGTEAEFNAANAGIEASVDGANGAAETANVAAENANTAAYRSMLWRETASGNPVSVYPVPESPLYPKVSGAFTQAGTGDPSPSNIRPITPWLTSGAEVDIVQTDGATITLTAPQEIAAGWMDNEGQGQVTWGTHAYTGGEDVWDPDDLGNTLRFRLLAQDGNNNVLCTHFPMALSYDGDFEHVYRDGVLLYIYVLKSRLSTLDTNGLKAYLAAEYAAGHPVAVAYELATPVSITPAAAPLTALPQLDRITPRLNVLTTSTGSIELTYAKSPIRESDDIAAAIAAL